MKILVLGGTQFVGRQIVEELVAAEHAATVFNRGRTPDALPASVERLRGDRDGGPDGLAALFGRRWDACLDVSGYYPAQVRASVNLLRDCVAQYVFVSAVSVYGDQPSGPVTEDQPRLPPAGDDVECIDSQTYGALKVACEDAVLDAFAERCTLLRPQIVAGPYDPLDRFSYWVRRVQEGGELLAPGDGADYVQLIDSRDVARFARLACERGLSGAYNLSGVRRTWAEFLRLLGADNPAWTPAEVLRWAGVAESELPLFRPGGGPRSSLMHVCNARAIEAGLTLTDLPDTALAVAQWLGIHAVSRAMSREREAELLRLRA